MEGKKLRTAAYCRVSTTSDTQDGSFEVQCDYYEKLIRNDPNMEFVGVYGDHGKSGRAMKGRKELNRLIKDCEAGKIDLILTKSISRFARNMLECVEAIRHLKECGVTVRFEKENLDTETMGGELMLGILATIAQEESNSISMNLSWSRQKHVEKGQPWDTARYGFVSVGKEHRWEVVEHEAEVVRQAFYMAGMCYTYGEIAEELTRMEKEDGNGRIWNKAPVVNLLRSETLKGIADNLNSLGMTGRSGEPLTDNGVLYILGNEVYVGDKMLQKRAPKNFLTKQPDKRTPFESNYLVDDHEAVVDRLTWDAVQKKLMKRREDIDSGVRYHDGRTHFFYGTVFCGECGEPMTRRTLRGYKGERYKAWTCRDRHKGRRGNGCMCRTIRETDLITAICVQMDWEQFDEGRFEAEIEKVVVTNDEITLMRRLIPVTA